MTKEIRFNINDLVRVKLTEHGKYVLATRPYKVTYAENDDGWSRWQMWHLMSLFGDAMYCGCKVPFEPTIMIEINEK